MRARRACSPRPRQPLAGLVGKIDLRRLARRGTGDEQRLARSCPSTRRWRMPGRSAAAARPASGNRAHRPAGRATSSLVPVKNSRCGSGPPRPGSGHHPRPLRQLLPLAVGEAIEVAEAVALGPPDQAAVLEEAVVVGQVDPVPGAAFSLNSSASRRSPDRPRACRAASGRGPRAGRRASCRPAPSRRAPGRCRGSARGRPSPCGRRRARSRTARRRRWACPRPDSAARRSVVPLGADRRAGDHADRRLVEPLDRDRVSVGDHQ